jgi:hypothetical protein
MKICTILPMNFAAVSFEKKARYGVLEFFHHLHAGEGGGFGEVQGVLGVMRPG